MNLLFVAPPDPLADAPAPPLPANVKALGVVSLCTDLSSEMVYPVNAVFLTRVLGAPPEAVGLIEGVAESTASLLKLYSGHLSDKFGRRKPLTLAGYGLAAVSKPLIGFAGAWGQVFFARFLDRTGKGLRSSPRDALLADEVPKSQRGRAFGLHRSMDTAGAVLGPLLGWLYLRQSGTAPPQLRNLYLLAFLPALAGVLVLLLFVREKAKPAASSAEGGLPKAPAPPLRKVFRNLSPEYRRYLGVVLLFGLGNSSDSFLILRAEQDMGVSAGGLLLLYALFNVVEAALGYFAGRWSDRVGRRPLITAGWLVFALVYLGFALLGGAGPGAAAALFVLYGFYSTLTGGVQKALAADFAHPERRGAEIGVFHLLVGITALPASVLAGLLYKNVSHAAPFFVGAATALLSALLLHTLLRRRPRTAGVD